MIRTSEELRIARQRPACPSIRDLEYPLAPSSRRPFALAAKHHEHETRRAIRLSLSPAPGSAARSKACTCRSPGHSRNRAGAAGRSESPPARPWPARARPRAPWAGSRFRRNTRETTPSLVTTTTPGGVGVQLGLRIARVAKTDRARPVPRSKARHPSENASPIRVPGRS